MSNCIYNGVELTTIPVVEGCDYSCVAKDIDNDIYWAFVRSEAEKLIITIADGRRFTGSKKGYKLVDSVWEEATSIFALDPIWANYNIVNPNGELILEASDPVPVSPVKLNPALLVQSFFTGQAIRRSRK